MICKIRLPVRSDRASPGAAIRGAVGPQSSGAFRCSFMLRTAMALTAAPAIT
jgi:hypothetical protein